MPRRPTRRLRRFVRMLGPGIVTGAADDDPSGIATYSQTGAQFGFGLAWTMLYTLPLMTAVQEACARIGCVRGQGLAAVVRDRFSRKVLVAVVALVLIANIINIGADIEALGAAARLVVPLPPAVWSLLFVAAILGLEIFVSYRVYVRVLKWLVLTLLAYPLTAFISSVPWRQVLRATLVPHLRYSFAFFFIIMGVLGTTISPYLFFWETSQVVEEEIDTTRLRREGAKPRFSTRFLRDLRIDNALGMFASNAAAWFIIVTTATVLHGRGLTDIKTAADAAQALQPLVHTFPHAGLLAKAIFAVGIIGLGLLAVPTLAGSASYALSETLRWPEGLYRSFKAAHRFYGVIALSTIAGLGLTFTGVNPIKALIATAVLNGVAAAPLLFLIARIARDEGIMGRFRSGWLSHSLVCVAFVAMVGASLVMMVSFLHG